MKLHPILKWVGGKTQLLPEIVSKIPADTDIYVEPFLGGGAVFLDVLVSRPNIKLFIVNDANKQLMSLYGNVFSIFYPRLVKELKAIEKAFNEAEDKKEFYYNERKKYNDYMINFNTVDNTKDKVINRIKQNARLMFLNKTCFNGLYRVNGKGEFNAAFNNSTSVSFDYENLDNLHSIAETKTIYMSTDDYKNICCCDAIKRHLNTYPEEYKKVFVYLDPPYKPIKESGKCVSYTSANFDDVDQTELKEMCDEIHKNGYMFLQSNSEPETNFFGKLYADYNITTVKARRNINSDGAGRGKINEILISNFNNNYGNVSLF